MNCVAISKDSKRAVSVSVDSTVRTWDLATGKELNRHKDHTEIAWCSGPTCRLLGGDRIREAIQQTLELPLGGHSDDHRYGLHMGQCNGTCHEAPMVWVNGKVVGGLTVTSAIQLARKVKAGE